jgi:DNA-binding transcriptional ArsR family regulator
MEVAPLEQVRVLAHPLRLRLYELFALSPRTTMQAATELGQPPTRLYHHVAELERAGLVRLRETRPNRGTVEKYYEAAQQDVAAVPAIRIARGKAGRIDRATAGRLRNSVALGSIALDRAREEFVRALGTVDEGSDPLRLPLLARILVGTKPKDLRRVRKVVQQCLERLMALGSGEVRPGETPWSITLAMIPAGVSTPQPQESLHPTGHRHTTAPASGSRRARPGIRRTK